MVYCTVKMNNPDLFSKYGVQSDRDTIYALQLYKNKVRINNNASVVDVGCGPGGATTKLLLPHLPQTINKLVGIDISSAMIEYAEKKYKNISNVFFHKFDILNENVPKQFCEAFDNIFSFYCLHFVKNQRKALTTMYKMLKPGGEVLITFLGNICMFEVCEFISKIPKFNPYMRDFDKTVYTTHKYKNPDKYFEKLLKEVGFIPQSCMAKQRIHIYSEDSFINISIAVNTFSIPKELQQEYALKHLEFFREKKLVDSDDDGKESFHCPYTLVVAHAKKPYI